MDHREFVAMCDEDLDFSQLVARSLLNISKHPVISDKKRNKDLPVGWSVLRHLAQLSEEDFEDARDKDLINADTSQRAAQAIKRAYMNKDSLADVRPTGQKKEFPSPQEAKKIAMATGKVVAASDGKVYTPSPDAEINRHANFRHAIYVASDAIGVLSESDDASKIVDHAPEHLLRGLEIHKMERAETWLRECRKLIMEKKGVIDHGRQQKAS
jgi:hypothetical protein